MESGQDCAYNQTRECFIGLKVVTGDFSAASFHDWMTTLKPNTGAAMWMVPFRGLPATEVHVPLDLLYLDAHCRVLEAVEFYPNFRVSAACPPAASVLALPTHSIFSSQTQAGDELIVCPADELNWRLEQYAETGTNGGAARPHPGSAPLRPVLVRGESREPVRPALVREEPGRVFDPIPAAPVPGVALVQEESRTASVPQAAPQAPPHPPAQRPRPDVEKPWLDPARQPAKQPLGRLGRWLFSDPPDPRKASRQPIAGLVAHFFTGGAPQAHEIRDVSPTGLYVVTTERWYPGTIIRMTLTKPDNGQAPSERSITIQARSVRWGNDGVGLEFLLDSNPNLKRGQASSFEPVDAQRLNQFLTRLNGVGR